MILLYPGTFDPLHLGHVDLVRRARALCEQLVVGIGINPAKQPLLPAARRLELARTELGTIAGVRCEIYEGSTLSFARTLGAGALLRGVRNVADLEFEETMAAIHRSNGLETMFLMTDGRWGHISGTAVRLALSAGLPLNELVPPSVAQALQRR